MPSGRIGHEQSPRDFLSAGSDDPSALIATNGHDASPRTDGAQLRGTAATGRRANQR
jgi:hypothetical protein